MQRTQISLEKEQYQLLSREARRRGISLSALLRELVVARYQQPRGARAQADPLARITGLGEGTGEALGRSHNELLYARKRA
ncbi:MAG: ribbon-helix-helix protein, CopG family [Betaproteobacteria bacterium]